MVQLIFDIIYFYGIAMKCRRRTVEPTNALNVIAVYDNMVEGNVFEKLSHF